MKYEPDIKMHMSSRDTWDLINATLGKSKSTQHIDRDTALSLISFFCSVGQNITTNVRVNSYPDGVVLGAPRVLSTKFDLRPATLAELRSVVRSLKIHLLDQIDFLPFYLDVYLTRYLCHFYESLTPPSPAVSYPPAGR